MLTWQWSLVMFSWSISSATVFLKNTLATVDVTKPEISPFQDYGTSMGYRTSLLFSLSYRKCWKTIHQLIWTIPLHNVGFDSISWNRIEDRIVYLWIRRTIQGFKILFNYFAMEWSLFRIVIIDRFFCYSSPNVNISLIVYRRSLEIIRFYDSYARLH